MLPNDPGQMATVLVALAITDGSPSQIREGNVTSVPPPATELMAPAMNAAPNATAECDNVGMVMRMQTEGYHLL